jgi:hypothetical protein
MAKQNRRSYTVTTAEHGRCLLTCLGVEPIPDDMATTLAEGAETAVLFLRTTAGRTRTFQRSMVAAASSCATGMTSWMGFPAVLVMTEIATPSLGRTTRTLE